MLFLAGRKKTKCVATYILLIPGKLSVTTQVYYDKCALTANEQSSKYC